MEIKVEGLDGLLMKVKLLGGNTDKALKDGLLKAGKQIQGYAKLSSPFDTGQLRNSIEVTGEKELKYEYMNKAGDKFSGTITGGDARTVVIGTNVEYAPYAEYGTGQRGDPSVDHRHDWVGMEPRPFLQPAATQGANRLPSIMTNALKKAIKESMT